jgi:putative membrane protein
MVTRPVAAAWGAAGIVVAAGLAPLLVPGSSPPMSLGMLGLILFLVVHGSLTYGLRGAVDFLLCVYPVAFAFEALAIATGFPFGFFTHNSPGLHILGVPPTVPVVYAVAGYVAWSIARLVIVGDRPGRLIGSARFSVPPVAALVLAGYDAVTDPGGATVGRQWSYGDPSGLFGVPLTNFLGWVVTGWVAFQLFALLAPPARRIGLASVLPPVVWLAVYLPSVGTFVTGVSADPTDAVAVAGRTFLVADIQESAVIVGMFSMGTPALMALACVLLARDTADAPDRGPVSPPFRGMRRSG